MIINDLMNDTYFNKDELNTIKSTTTDEIIEIFNNEVKLKNAIDNDEVEYTYVYNIGESENLLIQWFCKKIIKLDVSKVDLDKFEKITFKVSNPSLSFSTKVNVPLETEIMETVSKEYLQNLAEFLKESSNNTKEAFNYGYLYVLIDSEVNNGSNIIEFTDERFIDNFSTLSDEIKKSFSIDLYKFIQKNID